MEAKYAITCARNGDVDFFKIVAPEILHEARDAVLDTVLTVAAREGHLDCCEVIVQRCPPLLYYQVNVFKWSVLHRVVAYRGDNNLENIMRFLITADSKPDLELGGGPKIPLLTMQDYWDCTALHRAVKYGKHWATKLLLQADRDFVLLRMVDNHGRTCLHFAVMSGDQDMVKLICEADPDKQLLSMPDSKGNTPLYLAVRKNNFAIVQLLLEAYPSNDLLGVVDSHGRTTLHYAVEADNLDMVKLMCKAGLDKQLLSMLDSKGNTPLYLAIRNNNLAIVRLLLEADPSNDLLGVVDSKQATTLYYAVEQGNNLGVVKFMCKVGLVRQLLRMPYGDGSRVFRLVVENNNLAIVQLLLEVGNCNNLMEPEEVEQIETSSLYRSRAFRFFGFCFR